MISLSSNKAAKKIAARRIQHNKSRNIFIGIIIMFAAGILTFVSAYAYNIIHEHATETAYQAIYLNLTQNDISNLKSDERIERIGMYQSAGTTLKESGITMGMVCADENTMRLSNIMLAGGTMPHEANELLVEKGYLNTLGIQADIGDTITLEYRNYASREVETQDFLIVGFIRTTAENDKNRIVFNSVVSEKFVRKNIALSQQPLSAMIAVREAEQYTNQEIKSLVQDIGFVNGFSENQIQVNNLYIDSNNASSETILTIFAVGIVLLGTCSLVVYNIFYISVVGNVTAFGQLRTIGATKQQVKKIVSFEGTRLALQFIPCGCLLGYAMSFLIDKAAFQPVTDLMIVLLAGLASFAAVKISIRKPAIIATTASPITAFNYNAYAGSKKVKRRDRRLTPGSLAFMNLTRNKQKSALTFISLALSGMLLMGTSSLFASLDPVERAKQSFPYDGAYIVELNRALLSPTVSITDLQAENPLTEELQSALMAIDGIESIIPKKELRATIAIDGTRTVIWGMNAEDRSKIMNQLIDGDLPDVLSTGSNTLILNINGADMEYLTYSVGDTITFLLDGGGEWLNVNYTVAALFSDKNSSASFILPDSEIEKAVPYNRASSFVLRATDAYSAEAESSIQALISSNTLLHVRTLNDQIALYRSVFSTMAAALYMFIAFIAAFSVINLVNTTMTNMISRRKEIGLLRAVGLELKQLNKMISIENLFQTFGSFIFSIVLGTTLGKLICSIIQNTPGFGFVKYTFPLWVLIIYMVAVVLLQVFITKWANRYFKRISVIEQIRTSE